MGDDAASRCRTEVEITNHAGVISPRDARERDFIVEGARRVLDIAGIHGRCLDLNGTC